MKITAPVVALAALVLTGCSSSTAAKPSTVTGTVILRDTASARAAALNGANATTPGCVGLGAYSGVKAGSDVDIADDSGKTLALAPLAGGTVADAQATACRFTFSASVRSERFYRVTVTGQRARTVSRSELRSGVTVTVGTG